MNVFNFPNKSGKFNTQIPWKNIEIHPTEIVNKTGNSDVVQENTLQLHHPSSDNYDKSNRPYTVRDQQDIFPQENNLVLLSYTSFFDFRKNK
jgi:hypothetical protein